MLKNILAFVGAAVVSVVVVNFIAEKKEERDALDQLNQSYESTSQGTTVLD